MRIALLWKLAETTEKIMHLKQTKTSQIALFFKSYTIKACSIFILVSLITCAPTRADAFNLPSLPELIKNIIGGTAQATEGNNETPTPDGSSNSQNMQVLATASIDPDTKNVNDGANIMILEGGELTPGTDTFGSGLENVSGGEMTVYEVAQGDTLSEIAMQFDVSTNTIKWENNLTSNTLKVGQKLNILPVTGVKHTIKKGDTLEKIALKYDAEVEDIKVFNGIMNNGELKTGEVLYVPNGVIKAVVVIQKPTSIKKGTITNVSDINVGSGYYMKPVSGSITSSYGSRHGSFHYGVDIGARYASLVAAASGTVVAAVSSCKEGQTSCGGRYGNYIVIEHPNGQFTRYAHLSKVSVSVGQSVTKGKTIGVTGNTGHTTGPHLHFQIERSNGSTIKPVF